MTRPIFYTDAGVTGALPGDDVQLYLDVLDDDEWVDGTAASDLPGDHAEQVNTSKQPVLGRAPKEVRNLWPSYSNDYAQSDWGKLAGGTGVAPVVTSNYATGPDGEPCDRVQFDKGAGNNLNGGDYSIVNRSIAVVENKERTSSVNLKTNDETNTNLILYNVSEAAGKEITVTGNWQRFELPYTGDDLQLVFGIRSGDGGSYFEQTNAPDTADILVGNSQVEDGGTATNDQTIKDASGLDITESGVPSYYYLRPDAVDDALPQVLPAGMTGDLMIFGRDGSWIDEGVTVAAGGTLTAINGANSPGMAGIIKALGDIVGWLPLDRTLTAWERSKLVSYFKDRGAKGLLVPNGVERVANGTFDTDFTGWVETGTVTSKSVTGGVASITADNLSGIKQDLDFSDGVGFYRISFDLLSTTGSVQIIANVSGSSSTLSPIYNSAGAKEFVFEVGDGASGLELLIRSRANANTFEIDNVSVQKLVIQ